MLRRLSRNPRLPTDSEAQGLIGCPFNLANRHKPPRHAVFQQLDFSRSRVVRQPLRRARSSVIMERGGIGSGGVVGCECNRYPAHARRITRSGSQSWSQVDGSLVEFI